MIRTLAINTGSNFMTLLVKLTITFIMTPVFIHNLGHYDYGLWEMLMAIMGYAGMIELGIGPTASRYAAKLKAERDPEELQKVYECSLVFLAAMGFLLLVIFILWAKWFPQIIAPNGTKTEKYALLLIILGANLFIRLPGRVAESFLEGYQKYYLKNNIIITNSIASAIVVFTFITPQNGLILLAAVNTVGLSVKYTFFFIILTTRKMGDGRVWPGARFSSLSRLPDLLTFGGKSFIQGVATRVENATDTLVIGTALGPALVPIYSIPANLVRYLRTIGWTASHAFMPLFSDLSARNEAERIQDVYLVASRYVVGLLLPMGLGMCLIGKPFLTLWIGPEIAAQADVIVPLLVAFTITPMFNPFASRYLTAIGKHGVFARWQPVAAAANLGLSILLAQQFGIVGVAIASLLPTLVITPYFLSYSCRHLGITMGQYVKASLLPVFPAATAMVLVVGAYRSEYGIASYPSLAAAVALGAVVYGAIFWFSAVSRDERSFIVTRAQRLLTRA